MGLALAVLPHRSVAVRLFPEAPEAAAAGHDRLAHGDRAQGAGHVSAAAAGLRVARILYSELLREPCSVQGEMERVQMQRIYELVGRNTPIFSN